MAIKISQIYNTIAVLLIISVCTVAEPSKQGSASDYCGPSELLFIDDDTLLILQQDACRLDWFSVSQGKLLHQMPLPLQPHCMITCGNKIYLSCGWIDGQVLEIDMVDRKILRTWKYIHTPWALAAAPQTNKLYVGRRFNNDIMVLDISPDKTAELSSLVIPVLREPTTMVITPDQKTLFVGNALPTVPSNGSVVSTAVSKINLEDNSAIHYPLTDGSTVIRGMTISPDGQWVMLVHNVASHRSVTTQLAGGWTSRNGLTFFSTKPQSVPITYLLDDSTIGVCNPWEIKISPDGQLLCISVAGNREAVFFSMEKLLRQIERDSLGMTYQNSYYFGVGSFSQIIKRISMPDVIGPRAVAMNDKYTVLAGYFSDNLAVFSRNKSIEKTSNTTDQVERFTQTTPRLIALGDKKLLSAERRGEILFHDGEASLESWHSCATCHPDARVDGMNWDLLNDGTGNHKNTKSMLLAHQTPPCMALGVRATAEEAVKAGFIHIHFSPRPESDYLDVDEYLKSLKPIPGPKINPDGTLCDSAKRGKKLFHSLRKTGCAVCHYGPYLTDMKMHNVNTESDFDFGDCEFDTPSLIELHRTAPYLHDGRYTTLDQLLYQGNHGNTDGKLNRLSDQEKSDLMDYLLSL